MNQWEIKDFMEAKVLQYNHPKFLEEDPLQIPHRFSRKEDIEIGGFLTATIAWGNRKSIIKSAQRMMELLEGSPYEFVMGYSENELSRLSPFVHRTFNGSDLLFFVSALRRIYSDHGGLEGVLTNNSTANSTQPALVALKRIFFEVPHPERSRKHLPDPGAGSAAKRLNMFLRWMVRKDQRGVDFGLWPGIPPSRLSCPLDVHSGNVARRLGLLNRKQNDARAVAELDARLRGMDPNDPVKYDFALFGLGVFEKWS